MGCAFAANSVKGQYYYNDEAPFSLGFTIGVNLSKTNQSDSKMRPSYNAGINFDVNLQNNLAIITGIDFWDKGSKYRDKETGSLNATYLSLPIQLGYRFEANPDVTLKLGLGGYIAYGVDGNNDALHPVEDTFGRTGFAKRWDYGLGISARVTLINIVQVRAGYDLGLANISKSNAPSGLTNIKTSNLYFAVGLKFF